MGHDLTMQSKACESFLDCDISLQSLDTSQDLFDCSSGIPLCLNFQGALP